MVFSGLSAVLALYLAALSPEDVARARELEHRASALQHAGQYAEAEQPLLDAIALWSAAYGPDHIEVLNDQMNLGVSYRRRGEASRAIPLLERASEGLKRSDDPDAPDLYRRALNNLAIAYQHDGRIAEARTTLESLLSLLEAGGPSEERARVLDNLAGVLLETPGADLAQAARYARRGLEDWRTLRGEDDLDVAISRSALGTVLMRQGALAEARTELERALGLERKILGADHPEVASILLLLSELESRSGNADAARRDAEAALAIGRSRFDDGHPLVQEASSRLAALDSGTSPPPSRLYIVIAALWALLWALRKSAGRLAPRAAIAPLVFLISRWPVLLAWGLGSTGCFALFAAGARAKGHTGASDLAVLAGISVLCGLGFAALTVGAIWAVVRAFTPAPRFELEAGETIERELLANHFLNGEARGGRLFITDRRWVFRPHRFNVQLALWSAARDRIETLNVEGDRFLVVHFTGETEPTWLVVPNARALCTALSASPRAHLA